jgi:hypothetical protein
VRGYVPPPIAATSQTQQVLDRLGGHNAYAVLSQLPRRTPIRPGDSSPMRPQPKPFQAIGQEPTISPYLNLHRAESDEEGAPNYFAFVRPQLEQIEDSRRQQSEILRLQRQMQSNASASAVSGARGSAVPTTGVAARYMDTAQFYSGWKR